MASFPNVLDQNSPILRFTINYTVHVPNVRFKAIFKQEPELAMIGSVIGVLPKSHGLHDVTMSIDPLFLPLDLTRTYRINAYIVPETSTAWGDRIVDVQIKSIPATTSTPTLAPTVAPSLAPSVSPTATPTTVLSTVPLVLVRPFFGGDVDVLVASFSKWNNPNLPCALEGDIPTHGTVDLLLYYARNISDAPAVQAIVSQLDSSTDAWRKCIGTITILGANLTASEDVYNPSGDGVDWNRGPNTQFYRIVPVFSNLDVPFFYMESDTVPSRAGWLDAIRAEIAAKAPFAVLGSRYAGHKCVPPPPPTPTPLPTPVLFVVLLLFLVVPSGAGFRELRVPSLNLTQALY
jgi:hypothetical protein